MEKISFMTDAQYIDTCNAIREKGGSTGLIKSGEMAAKIRAIPTGTISKSMLIITAPTGSTVTASNGTVTKTAAEDKGTWTFTGLDIGTWTVTATLLGKTKTITVPIERLTIEYRTISYGVYLYNRGDMCEPLTGGWVYRKGNVEYAGTDRLIFNVGKVYGAISTANGVDFTDYSKLCVSVTKYKDIPTSTKTRVFLTDSYSDSDLNAEKSPSVLLTGIGIHSVDVRQVSSPMIIVIEKVAAGEMEVSEVWVE